MSTGGNPGRTEVPAGTGERAPARTPTWREVPERGFSLGIQIVVWLTRLCGRRAAFALLWLISVHYALFDQSSRRASQEFLRRAGHSAGFRDVITHIWTFARVALDRMLFLSGNTDGFDIRLHGHEHIMACVAAAPPLPGGAGSERGDATAASPADPSAPSDSLDSRRGAILLGSHLGSFEAMRAVAHHYAVPLWIVADFRNAARINAVLDRVAKGVNVRAIGLDPSAPAGMLAIKHAVDRGELVAILADRVTERKDRATAASFLGKDALFPMGPYVLAHVLGCPVFLVFALFSAPNRYDIHCEPFASRIRLPRSARGPALSEWVAQYAARLEAQARRAPMNWFNFFDFWSDS